MEQETANKLFEEGAFLFLFNVPQGTEIGIDFSSWKTGEKFKGLKMIPPGIHFVYYRYDKLHLILVQFQSNVCCVLQHCYWVSLYCNGRYIGLTGLFPKVTKHMPIPLY